MKSRICFYIAISSLVVLFACDRSKKAFEDARELGTIEAYEKFIDDNPNSKYAHDAKASVDSLRFQEAKSKNTRAAYKNFIMQYSDSKFVDATKAILDTLRPTFPQLAQSVKLPKNALRKYNEAMAMYPKEPISGVMSISDIRKKEELFPQQKQWLETGFADLEEYAQWILERDFEKASK